MSLNNGPFRKTLAATFFIALGLIVAGAIGVIWVSSVQANESMLCPTSALSGNGSATGGAKDGKRVRCAIEAGSGLSPSLAVAASSLFATIFAVGVVSVVVDVGLRRRFGNDLYRYLGLKEALVTTGLADAGRASEVDLRSRLSGIDELRYLGRTPAFFLTEQIPALMRLAETRRLQVTVGLPDPDNDDLMIRVADALGLTDVVLSEAIRAFTNGLAAQWQIGCHRVITGTAFRVVYVATEVPFEACAATNFAFLGLGRPYGHTSGDEHLLAVFESSSDFPTPWIAESLAMLDQIPAAWEDARR